MDFHLLLYRLFLVFSGIIQVANTSWWYLSQLEIEPRSDPRIFCELIPKAYRRQRQICQKYSDVMESVAEGIRSAISECQFQFHSSKWNCSTFEHDASVFGKYLVRGGTRELSYLNAITTASAIFMVARDCASGKLSCGCSSDILESNTDSSKDKENNFKWKGCAQNVIFSLNFVRRFVDAGESSTRDATARATLHNNRAGRQAFEKQAPSLCKCHGLSGSCTMQTCWRTPPSIRALGSSLKEKYDGAIRITIDPAGRLIPADKLQKKPTKLNLVYFEDSPDFCFLNRSRGILGTGNRSCNATSEGEDSCDILCCGRGWTSVQVSVSIRCGCRFNWCCEVECKKCTEVRVESRCNPYPPAVYSSSSSSQRVKRNSSRTRSHNQRLGIDPKVSNYTKKPIMTKRQFQREARDLPVARSSSSNSSNSSSSSSSSRGNPSRNFNMSRSGSQGGDDGCGQDSKRSRPRQQLSTVSSDSSALLS